MLSKASAGEQAGGRAEGQWGQAVLGPQDKGAGWVSTRGGAAQDSVGRAAHPGELVRCAGLRAQPSPAESEPGV